MTPRRPRTLTWRIAWLLIVIVLLGGFLTAAAATIGIRQLLLSSLDSQLAAAANQHEARMPHTHPGSPNPGGAPSSPDDLRLPLDTITATIKGGRLSDTVISRTGDDKSLSASATNVLAQHTNSRSPVSVGLPGYGDYRILVTHTDDGVLLTGLPQSRVQRVVTEVIVIEAITVGAAAAAMALVAALAVRRAMRPLSRIARSAEQVSHTPLTSGNVPALQLTSGPRPAAREVAALSEALETMLAHVRDAFGDRDASELQLREFIADASHELRTPVAVIRSHTELIESTIASAEVPDQVNRSLHRIGAESLRMSNIVGDLLLLARLDQAPNRQVSSVDVSRIVLEIVDDARTTAADHRWLIDLPDHSVEVLGDPDQLRRAVLNLVSNAARHTPGGTVVTVTAESGRDGVRISVEDNGPGISPEVQESLGQRFVRDRNPHPDSTGLGFALVVAIAHRHGGRVEVVSTPGRTMVALHLPSVPTRAEPSPA